jgi:hypothetical protein
MATQEDEYAELLARANAEFEELGYVTEQTNEALLDAKTGVKNFSQAVAGPATQAIKSLGGVVGKTATAMYKGEKGAKAFDGALDSASEAADSASKALFALGGPLGMVAGAIAFLIGKAAKAVKVVNEQLDKEQEAFQNLSKSGMAASDGMTGLFSDMQKMRVNVLDSAKYQQMLAENSKDLATFGGTAFDGRKKLADVSAGMEDFRLSMNRLGMTEDDQREAVMGYIKSETQFGRAQGKTAEELAEGAKKYLTEQDALTKLSGVDRKTREQARNDALKEQGYAATLAQMRKDGLGDQAKRMEEANDIIADKLPETAKGLRALMSGNLSNADGLKLFGTGLAEIQSLQAKVKTGEITKEEYAAKIAKNIKEYSDRQGIQQAMYEQNDKIALSFAEQQEARRLSEGNYFQNYKEAVKETADTLTKPDPVLDDMAKAQKANTDAMLNTQAAVQQAAPAAAKGMLAFAEAAEKASRLIGGKDGGQTAAAPTELGFGPGKRAPQTREDYEELDRQRRSPVPAAAPVPAAPVPAAAPPPATTAAPAPAAQTPPPSAAPPVQITPKPQDTAAAKPAVEKPKKVDDYVKFGGETGQRSNFDQLTPDFQTRLLAAIDEYQKKGGKQLNLTSAYRPPEDQERIYKTWKDAGGNLETKPTVAGITTPALPASMGGRMNAHGRGQAIDAGSQAADINSKVKLADFGLKWGGTFRKPDPPHIQDIAFAARGGIFPAKPGGQHVVLAEGGQDEAVIPMKDGAVQVSMRNPGPMDDMAKPDIDAAVLGEMSESMTMGIKEDLRSMVMDIVQQIQRPGDNSGMSQAVLTQLDQLIQYQREANDIDNRMLSVASN